MGGSITPSRWQCNSTLGSASISPGTVWDVVPHGRSIAAKRPAADTMQCCKRVGYNKPMQQRDLKLIKQWIEANPYRPGVENVRLRQYAVPVWALVGHAQATGRSAEQVAADYEVPREAVEAALAYYRENRNAIDSRIAANAA